MSGIGGIKGGPGWKPEVSEVEKKADVQAADAVKKLDATPELPSPGLAKLLEQPLKPATVPPSSQASINEHHSAFAAMLKDVGPRGDVQGAKFLEVTHDAFEKKTSPAALPAFFRDEALRDINADLSGDAAAAARQRFDVLEKVMTDVGVAVVKAKDGGPLLGETEKFAATVKPMFTELRAVCDAKASDPSKKDALTAKGRELAESIAAAHEKFAQATQAAG